MARSSRLPPAVHDRLTEQLEKLLDEEEDLRGKKKRITKRITKALNDEIGLVEDSIYQTRLRLKGLGGEQAEIPGTETGTRKRNPVLVQVLKAADGFREEPGDEDPEEPDDD